VIDWLEHEQGVYSVCSVWSKRQSSLLQLAAECSCRHVSPADSDHEFEASVLSDSLLDRKPRKRAINLALGLEELYSGGTKRLKVGAGSKSQ
jgi:hypothetical protein